MGEDAIPGRSEQELEDIEQKLNVKLPQDFREIQLAYTLCLLGGISILNISKLYNPNIIDETIAMRDAIDIEHKYILLENDRESVILLNTADAPAVLWVDSIAIERLNDLEPHESNSWNTFQEFFEYLINIEVEDREDEARRNNSIL